MSGCKFWLYEKQIYNLIKLKYKWYISQINETWKEGNCKECTCGANLGVVCVEYQCALCPEGTVAVYNRDECCPTCELITTTPRKRLLDKTFSKSIYFLISM